MVDVSAAKLWWGPVIARDVAEVASLLTLMTSTLPITSKAPNTVPITDKSPN